jgi:hypothetical protein
VKGGVVALASMLAACSLACSLALSEGEFAGGDNATDAASPSADATTDAPVTSGDANGGDGGEPPEPDLIGWWKLDETSGGIANDSSRYAHHGIATNTWVPGRRDGAAHFDGVTKVSIPTKSTLALSKDATLAFWLRTNAVQAGDPRVFSWGYGFYVKLNGDRVQMTLPDFGFAGAAASIVLGQWWHVAITYSSGAVAIYYNGAPVALLGNTIPEGTLLVQDQESSSIAAGAVGATQLAGDVDDVRLYRRVLSAQEIAELAK